MLDGQSNVGRSPRGALCGSGRQRPSLSVRLPTLHPLKQERTTVVGEYPTTVVGNRAIRLRVLG